MAIIKQTNKTTGITYVYESKSYWDPEKKQARSKRKLIGKIDPETGKMVPTGKKGPQKKKSGEPSAAERRQSAELARLKKENMDQMILITDLRKQIESLSSQNTKLKQLISEIRQLTVSSEEI
ncbi:hypothetical protein SG0102_18840 [Intestinibaculum porci]|uniref:Uncharacterized protein n=1 Tax=Intestinibaculum porci TaxID=2487118 RepID=A0A3G9JJS5_9FIRM|nr:hypothetical protein [Intestinibaculum porci]BBH25243.1 hypothetical protein SG0102_01770 [Intestinibaculum porci]BBH25277.1 hypothetical protein SG0102_02110 [Intestinibaculum porci]BBH26853.1 hypothetical protein SG0102_17870 [Intestinibaculum porci]BBH26865.1 hypothetical protein SG0102_17990 [Intestinibaculum porci]BBH26950.1 hypothetical protein SG0102_18840 [Intestinibaculum porci]